MSKFSEDLKRFILCDQTGPIKALFFTQGVWTILNYRAANFIYLNLKLPVIRHIALFVMYIWRKGIEVATNIYLPWTAEVGQGLHIAHCGFLVVHPQTRIGDYCTLSQGVTIGAKVGGENEGIPVIGNRVYISPNAVIIGGIKIGDDVMVGAGAVVTKSVPARTVIAGNPAKIISHKGSFDYIKYQGMESDPIRIESFSMIESETDIEEGS